MAKKKIILAPKSLLGFNKDLKICYNCMFWQPSTGRCPWYSKWNTKKDKEDTVYFDYNHHCENSKKDFRYRLDYKHYID